MKRIQIIRVEKGKNSTLSHLYIDDQFICYLLEDRLNDIKEAGLTCIPSGEYQIRLNRTALMNKNYSLRFPELHQGMIEICGIPNFTAVFIHIGNTISDTRGCPLTGHYWLEAAADYQVCQSAFAYKLAYPKLLSLLKDHNSYPIYIGNKFLNERSENGLKH
jgi:Family of unknown function (DUF5675)